MTLLLKTAWRHVLKKSNPLNKSLRSLPSITSEVTRSRSPDDLMVKIKTALTASEVLAAVQTNMPHLNHKHMLQALRCLFELQKAGKIEQNPETILKNPTFCVLCQNFKKHARALDVNEAIEATKVLSFLKVPADSLIVQTMLQLIRCNINMISVRQIMFVDFLLSRFDKKNHLVDALKLALPLAFQIHLPTEIDNQDLPLLRDMLSYACSNDIPDRFINNIVTGLILQDKAINAQMAKSIIWSLCQINCTEVVYPSRVQLLHMCCEVLTNRIEELSYDDVLRTVAKLKGRILEKHPEYYHEQLMDAIGKYVIINRISFEKSLLVARVFSRVAHTHLGLVGYLCKLAISNRSILEEARPNILFGFINCLSNNNFIPDHWDEISKQISRNSVLDGTQITLPWPKVCLELASLGTFEDRLLTRVFSKEFLTEFLSREDNVLDYLQLLTLYEAVNTFHDKKYELPPEILEKAKSLYPTNRLTEELEKHLALGLGSPEYIVRNVVLPNGIVSDCFICLKRGSPIKLPNCSGALKVPVDCLNLPDGSIPVCILNFQQGCFSMNSNRLRGTFQLVLDILEKQGYATVAINTTEWLSAPAHDRTAYLIREVGYKCAEIGIKLAAT